MSGARRRNNIGIVRTTERINTQLAACLMGDVSAVRDWEAVLALANETLLTPAIWTAVLQKGQQILLPDEVVSFLSFIHRCNVARNLRLRSQLEELVVALNLVGIVPLLTKGTALLATANVEQPSARIMRDLDVTVASDEKRIAEECLLKLQYAPIAALGWGRTKDVGAVDLHYPPGRYPEYWPSDPVLAKHQREIIIGTGKARVLSATLQAQHWIVHDLLKDGHLWNLHINLRNLFELYKLSDSDDGINWKELHVLLSDPLGRAMLGTQIAALRSVFATQIAQDGSIPPWLRLHSYLRSRENHPVLGYAIRSMGNAAWGIRTAQIHWRFRGPLKELPRRIVQKGQKIMMARMSGEI